MTFGDSVLAKRQDRGSVHIVQTACLSLGVDVESPWLVPWGPFLAF